MLQRKKEATYAEKSVDNLRRKRRNCGNIFRERQNGRSEIVYKKQDCVVERSGDKGGQRVSRIAKEARVMC